MHNKWEVTSTESGASLTTFLKSKLGEEISSRQIKAAIESNACLVNGAVERFGSFRVGAGDIIEFRTSTLIKAEPIKMDPARIIFEDQHLFIYNKPPGVESDSTLFLQAIKGNRPYCELVHRLDKDTTGLLIFAWSPDAAEGMKKLFQQREVKKTYWAIADGIPQVRKGKIVNTLGKCKTYQGQTLWGPVEKTKGLLAITEWECLKVGQKASLIVCYPQTGRTHQIRVHLSGLGHPILGDKQYGRKFQCNRYPQRCMLHAKKLEFIEPLTGQKIVLEATIPQDMHELMEELKLL